MSEAVKHRIKEILVESLKLKRKPESIPDQETLFGSGLNLDSVDILSLIAALEDEFQVRIEDHEVAQLNSVAAIAEFLGAKKLP